MTASQPQGRVPRPVLGLGYLVVVALLVVASIAAYSDALPWQRSADVELRTTQAGLGLRPQSDVKFQGLIVGEVRDVRTTGTEATVTLALDPDLIDQIPSDVDAMVVPKTLFGDKFVDLRSSAGAVAEGAAALRDGDTITQSSTAVELGQIFDTLVPVLEALEPERVSAVLSSLADVLDGRGADIAGALRTTDTLLGRLAPSYDDLVADIGLLASTADVYTEAAPDFIDALEDAAAISNENLVPHEADLAALLDSVTRTSATTGDVLATNRDDLVRLSGRARPVLEVLERYSGEVPCVLRALEAGNKLANLASGVRGPYIGLTIDMVVDQDPYTYPDDLPDNPRADSNLKNLPPSVPSFAPHCPVLPKRVTALGPTPLPYSQQPYAQTFDSRRDDDEPASSAKAPARDTSPSDAPPRDVLARAIAAEALGVDVADVPGYAELLLLPLTRGEVVLR